jgi:hypothetical protein
MRTMGRKLVVENLEGKVLLSSDLAAMQPVAAEVHPTSAGPAHRTPIDTIQGQMALNTPSPLLTANGIAGFHFTDASASLRPYGKFSVTGYSTNEHNYICFVLALERKGHAGERVILLVPQTQTGGASLPSPDMFAVRTYQFVPSKSKASGGKSTHG